MSEELIEAVREDSEERMTKAVAYTRSEFAGIRSGRANSGLVERLPVEYYGSTVPLQQLASFSVPEARMLVISPFDKASIGAIERSIREANIGLNPSNDGVQIRLGFPSLTEERRKEFVKMVRSKAEDGKTAVRGARRDARKDLEALQKDGDITEDQLRRSEEELDKMTKRHEAEIDAALESKTVELMEG
ncbi:MAG TPA: ribosome recycling factor [Microthrixaceae bacterium]|jgi:ribosome recycling factor|nr:ribosome recycling factor [Microthrixaceae bacterium]HQF95156.1 ribosome recycling factor [Microthrixaceae bacterium]